jgi:hypothetical protein
VWINGTEIVEVLADEAVEIGLKRLALAIGSGAGTGEANHGGPPPSRLAVKRGKID